MLIEPAQMRVISKEELSKHNHEDSVWIVLFGRVYDLTPYLNIHPGSEAPLIESAGKDATSEFKSLNHPKSAYETMKKYCIGEFEGKTEETEKSNTTLVLLLVFGVALALALGVGLFVMRSV